MASVLTVAGVPGRRLGVSLAPSDLSLPIVMGQRVPLSGHLGTTSWVRVSTRVRRTRLGQVRNERLRRAMLAQGFSVEMMAEQARTNIKTVRRWLEGKSVPYPKTR